MPEAAGRRVCLAISSFRNDESVERLLSSASTPRARGCFERVIVVDSLGTGRIEALLRSRDWSHVTYESASTNLGSAGNLARRLVLAAQTGCDYVFALNHDGELDLDIVDKLVEFAEKTPRVGAVYPLRYLTQQRRYLVPSRTWIPLPFNGWASRPWRKPSK
jgi:GT2 family glycosyltransferase